jgi:integrase/recombinase XerD
VIDADLRVQPVADRFLRELRFGRDRAESTTKAYAGGIALFLRWCARTGRDWQEAAVDMGLFMIWLRYTPTGDGQLIQGPGGAPVRSDSRINRVLVAVRGFLSFAVVNKQAPQWVLGAIYEIADSRDLPLEAQGEDGGLVYRMRARHHLRESETVVDRASDEEIVALFAACRSARDRLIVLLLSRAGLRRSEAAGLRRSDLHLLPDNRALGCVGTGAHAHIMRQTTPTAHGRSLGIAVRFRWTSSWCRPSISTRWSVRDARPQRRVTSCWSTCSVRREVAR